MNERTTKESSQSTNQRVCHPEVANERAVREDVQRKVCTCVCREVHNQYITYIFYLSMKLY